MKNNTKIIFHIDLNQFFCTVASNENPLLKGKVFAIGNDKSKRGVVSTATYEARKFGVRSGMSTSEALKICPKLILVNVSWEMINDYSTRFFRLIEEYVPVIERTSVDECYIDVTSITTDIKRHPVALAKEMQNRALKELSLPCSIGIAPTLYLAKMASDIKKPLGITVLRKRDVEKILYPLPISAIYGIGKKTYPRLEDKGIKTIADFFQMKETTISVIGERYFEDITKCFKGNTSNEVVAVRREFVDSISHCSTYDNDLFHPDLIKEELFKLCDLVHSDLIQGNYLTRTVTVIMRNTDFKTISRSKTIKPTDNITIIKYFLEEVFDLNYNGEPLRLIGCAFHNLTRKEEEKIVIDLFNFEEYYSKEESLDSIINDFKNRYGKTAFGFGEKLKGEDQNQ